MKSSKRNKIKAESLTPDEIEDYGMSIAMQEANRAEKVSESVIQALLSK